ncbi:MAG TPA: protein kinase [Byssovorax sp.]|jgi:serine/threonine-protein kinase
MDQAEAARRVGTTLCNKWKLERLLGVGGMAAVYAAAHKIGRRDAIKILHPDVAKNAELRSRFELEAHVANRFRHPGAVEIRDVDATDDGCPFLVMELLEGESLADRAGKGVVPVDDVLRWVDELLDVLTAAHAQNIVHRDIKLDNLFVTTEGQLKVLDFGIARVRDAGRAGFAKTAMGAQLGTATYMPPEQVQGRDIDGRADLFAVGATMFRVLARRRIHEAKSEADMLVKMGTTPAPPLGSVAPFVPVSVQQIVDRALRFDRMDRYPDAATMRADVLAVRAGRPPPYAASQHDATGPASMATMALSAQALAAGPSSFAAPTRAPTAAGGAPSTVSAVISTTAAAPFADNPTRVELDTRSRAPSHLGPTPLPLSGPPTSSAPAPPFREDPTATGAAASMRSAAATAVSAPVTPMSPTSSRTPSPGFAPMSSRTGAPGLAPPPASIGFQMPQVNSAPPGLVGTLKSAGIVPLPDHAPPSRPLVDVRSAPARLPPRSNAPLWLFGGVFLLLGIALAAWLAWPTHEPPQPHTAPAAEPPGNAKDDEEGERDKHLRPQNNPQHPKKQQHH